MSIKTIILMLVFFFIIVFIANGVDTYKKYKQHKAEEAIKSAPGYKPPKEAVVTEDDPYFEYEEFEDAYPDQETYDDIDEGTGDK